MNSATPNILYWCMYIYTQEELSVNAAHVLMELILDNRKIVDRITHSMIKGYIKLLRMKKVLIMINVDTLADPGWAHKGPLHSCLTKHGCNNTYIWINQSPIAQIQDRPVSYITVESLFFVLNPSESAIYTHIMQWTSIMEIWFNMMVVEPICMIS